MELFSWQRKYHDHFHEYFLSYLFDDSEAIEIMKKCIEEDKPYHPDVPRDRIY
ncbi:Uncharacterised protein [Levilactobacillus brevis]|nr:Uncharacterised protein [Levilactobacillus brevis]